jgi:hypothetical protein
LAIFYPRAIAIATALSIAAFACANAAAATCIAVLDWSNAEEIVDENPFAELYAD